METYYIIEYRLLAVSIGNVISNDVEPLYPGGLPYFIMSKNSSRYGRNYFKNKK